MILFFSLVTALVWSQPAPQFDKKSARLGSVSLVIEIAKTEEQRAHGLMYRKFLPENYGMLFIFDREQPLSFWMKNTYLPLSIGFFDKNKVLIEMQDMTPVKEGSDQKPSSYYSRKPAQYALEVNQGWFKKNKIKIGEKLHF